MKKLIITTVLLVSNYLIYSQIGEGYGLNSVDSCFFENPNTIIHLDTSSQNIWQIGKPNKTYFNNAYSPNNAIVTDTINYYPNSNHSHFDLKVSTFNFYKYNFILEFKHKFHTDTLTDGGYIEISIDNGATWTNVLYSDTIVSEYGMFLSENLYKQNDTLKGGINGFSGTNSNWTTTRLQWIWLLPMKSYSPDSVFIKYQFISDDIQNNKDGWLIDNIKLMWADLPSSIEKYSFINFNPKIYPNPANENIFIDDTEKIDLIEMYDNLGKLIYTSKNKKSYKIDARNLKNGIYHLKLTKNAHIITKKIVVKH